MNTVVFVFIEYNYFQLALEYSDKLQDNLNIFCIKYPEILTEELSNYILSSSDNYSRATLQFIDGLSVEFKNKLLRYGVSGNLSSYLNYILHFIFQKFCLKLQKFGRIPLSDS